VDRQLSVRLAARPVVFAIVALLGSAVVLVGVWLLARRAAGSIS
jgi:hypothetical protein